MKTFNQCAPWQRSLIALCVFTPLATFANPVTIEPSSLLAFMVVAFWALAVEAALVALQLTFLGVHPWRIFLGYGVTNALVFLFVFEPLLSSGKMSVPWLEALAVLLDALSIKIRVCFEAFQRDNFNRVIHRFPPSHQRPTSPNDRQTCAFCQRVSTRERFAHAFEKVTDTHVALAAASQGFSFVHHRLTSAHRRRAATFAANATWSVRAGKVPKRI